MKLTVGAALAKAEARLGKSGLPAGDALLLLAHCADASEALLLSNPGRLLSAHEQHCFTDAIKKRCQDFSVAVIMGYKYFFGLKFTVSKDTLVPRPESELMVEQALAFLSGRASGAVLDIGTGCGNILIAVARNTAGKKITWYGCDISPKALSIARKNARAHRLPIQLFESDLLLNAPRRSFNLVMANLPYLSTKRMHERSIRREPRAALAGGGNGLVFYKKLLMAIPPFLAKGALLLFEIDPQQAKEIKRLASQRVASARTEILSDLAGRKRLAKITT